MINWEKISSTGIIKRSEVKQHLIDYSNSHKNDERKQIGVKLLLQNLDINIHCFRNQYKYITAEEFPLQIDWNN